MSTFDQIQQLVITVFQNRFPNEDIVLESDFFDLGGDSMTLVELCTALEEKLGIEIAPSILLFHPTVEEFAEEVKSLLKAQ
ncbi:MAG: acyl carrier protein [Pseudoruegeria sp.]